VTAPHPEVRIIPAHDADHMEAARSLFRGYADTLGVDLSFQDFDAELAALPGDYQAPGGALLLAQVDGEWAGCCALRPIHDTGFTDAAEMKRLYVRSVFRGFGLGRQLAERILETAVQLGYARVLLDTLDDMEAARALYADLDFHEIPPYYDNPLPGAHYLMVDLRQR
jgi:GNAT superfamily N-acetyltransferase